MLSEDRPANHPTTPTRGDSFHSPFPLPQKVQQSSTKSQKVEKKAHTDSAVREGEKQVSVKKAEESEAPLRNKNIFNIIISTDRATATPT